MKVIQIERQWVKDYLNEVLEYQETFEEVYNHVLLSLQNEPEEQGLDAGVQNILDRDFGGVNGLTALEQQCYDAAQENARLQRRNYFKQWLTSLYALASISLFGMLYWLLHYKAFYSLMPLLFFVIFFAPLAMAARQRFISTQLNYQIKKSIKDEVNTGLTFKIYLDFFKVNIFLGLMSIIVQYIFFPGSFLYKPKVERAVMPANDMVFHTLAIISAAIFVLITANLAATIQLQRADFKPRLITN